MDVSLWIPESPLQQPLGPAADSSAGCLGPLHVLLSKVGLLRFMCPILSHTRDGHMMSYHQFRCLLNWAFPGASQFRSQLRAGMTRIHPAKALAAELDIWAAVCQEVRARCQWMEDGGHPIVFDLSGHLWFFVFLKHVMMFWVGIWVGICGNGVRHSAKSLALGMRRSPSGWQRLAVHLRLSQSSYVTCAKHGVVSCLVPHQKIVPSGYLT